MAVADSSFVPRFIYRDDETEGTKPSKLIAVDAETKLLQKRPHEGNFTVRSDQRMMKRLEIVASTIRLRLERGLRASVPLAGPCSGDLRLARVTPENFADVASLDAGRPPEEASPNSHHLWHFRLMLFVLHS